MRSLLLYILVSQYLNPTPSHSQRKNHRNEEDYI